MNGRPHLEFFTFQRVRARPAPLWLRMCAALSVSFLLHVAVVFLPQPGAGSPGAGMDAGLEVRLLPPEAKPAPDPQPAPKNVPAPARPQAPVIATVPGGGVVPVPAHHFHTADELTRRARPMNRPRLEVSESAPAFVSGTVILRVYVDALGTLVGVEIEKSDVPPSVAGEAAAAFRKLRYIPGEIHGRRVASLMRIEVSYLDGMGTANIMGAPR